MIEPKNCKIDTYTSLPHFGGSIQFNTRQKLIRTTVRKKDFEIEGKTCFLNILKVRSDIFQD